MEEIFYQYKKQLLVLLVLIVVIIFFFFINLIQTSSNKNKIVTNRDLVFTTKQLKKEKAKGDIPFLNIKIKDIDKINDNISTFVYNEVIVEGRDVSYEYYTNKNILSLLITSKQYINDDTLFLTKYLSYNVDLKNLVQLYNEDIVSLYNYTYDDVKQLYNNKLKGLYNEAKEKKFTNGYCDFSCYYDGHVIEDGNEAVYVTDEGFYYYHDFLYSSFMGDEDFFKNKSLDVFIPNK